MELTKKIKIALEETRMLILGAQILLGFQFRGVFDNGYDQLPSHLRYLDGIALLPMVCVVALLIAPGPCTVSPKTARITNISSGW